MPGIDACIVIPRDQHSMADVHHIPRFVASTSREVPDVYLVARGAKSPVLFCVHGISRNAAELAARFADHPAFDRWTIVAPLFEKQRFGKYQQMSANPDQIGADTALIALIRSLRERFGIDCAQTSLFGFSGGAQFVHRFAMLYPDCTNGAVAVSAGWYLWPDESLPWPYGIGVGVPRATSRTAMVGAPVTVLIGEQDLRIDGSVRQTPIICTRQGDTRLRRAKGWVKAMQSAAKDAGVPARVKLQLLQGGVHDFGACARTTKLLDQTAAALGQMKSGNV